MIKGDFKKLINELEESILDTDRTIRKAWLVSSIMVEPIKSKFIEELKTKELELNRSKLELEQFKSMLRD